MELVTVAQTHRQVPREFSNEGKQVLCKDLSRSTTNPIAGYSRHSYSGRHRLAQEPCCGTPPGRIKGSLPATKD